MDAFSYIDEPRIGLINMAIDDAMLDFADEHRVVVLRLYEWSEPTLSLGYFQKISDRKLHPPSSGLDLVRRATGGGAIVHHHDLTYSLAVPQAISSVGATTAIYSAVHSAIVEWLVEMGLAASQWRETYNLPTTDAQQKTPSKLEFLCFHRRSEGDVVVGDHKLLGSAQRRNKGALLQHGSLLVAKSDHAPSLSGLAELHPSLGNRPFENEAFREEFGFCIKKGIDALLAVSVKYVPQLAEELRSRADDKLSRLDSPEWRCRA